MEIRYGIYSVLEIEIDYISDLDSSVLQLVSGFLAVLVDATRRVNWSPIAPSIHDLQTAA